MDEEVDANSGKEFNIRLLIRHPSIGPDEITRALGLPPQRAVRAGTPRFTPKGRPLEGLRATSAWSHRRTIRDERLFSEAVLALFDHRGRGPRSFSGCARAVGP